MIYAEINLKTYYPPEIWHAQEIWHYKCAVHSKFGIYKSANTVLIGRAINYYPRERSFAEINVSEKVNVFAKKIIFAIVNIFSNFIPHKPSFCDSRNPPWISNKIKFLKN